MIGSVNFFEFTQGKKKLVFLDSFNFFKHSLKEIAKELGYKKYADDEEYNLNPEAWNKYIQKNGLELCKLDCKILYDKMQITINNDKITYGISQASGFRLYSSSSAYFLYPNSLAISLRECLKKLKLSKNTNFFFP